LTELLQTSAVDISAIPGAVAGLNMARRTVPWSMCERSSLLISDVWTAFKSISLGGANKPEAFKHLDTHVARF